MTATRTSFKKPKREKKIRLNVKIWNDQHELLRHQAFFSGISIAELLRKILDDTSYLYMNPKKKGGEKKND